MKQNKDDINSIKHNLILNIINNYSDNIKFLVFDFTYNLNYND